MSFTSALHDLPARIGQPVDNLVCDLAAQKSHNNPRNVQYRPKAANRARTHLPFGTPKGALGSARRAGHEGLGFYLVEQPSDVQSPAEFEVASRSARENALEEKREDGDTVDHELDPLTVEPIKAAFVRLKHSFQDRLALGMDMPTSHTPVNVVSVARDTAALALPAADLPIRVRHFAARYALAAHARR